MPNNIPAYPDAHVDLGTDLVDGVQYPLGKVAYGADGAVTRVDAAHGLPVKLASDQGTSVPVSVATGGIVDAGDVTQGALNDAVIDAGAAGTISAKLRRISTDIGALVATGIAAALADGADVAQGGVNDAEVAAGAVGTVSAKLRRLTDDVGNLLANGIGVKAGSAIIGVVHQPCFAVSDTLKRPANATPYAAQKSINCSLAITRGTYTGTTVTLYCASHPLVTGDRITVTGVNTGLTWTNVDGNWVVSAYDANSFSFVVSVQPTGTADVTATVNNAVAKMLRWDVAAAVGGKVLIRKITLSLPGAAMLGMCRLYLYSAQATVLVDQSTFTLLAANDTYRRGKVDLYPYTEGTGSDAAFAECDTALIMQCEAADTHIYGRLVHENGSADTPTSAGIVTVRIAGFQLP